MKGISHTKKVFFVAVALAVASLALYGFLFWEIKTKTEEAVKIQEDADKDVKREEGLHLAKVSLAKNKEAIEKIDSYFIARDGVVSFIEELESLGKETGVILSIGSVSAEADPKVKDDFKETLRIRLEASGSWENLFYFLSILESLPYRAQIEQMTLSLAGASDKIPFGSETVKRTPGKGEVWKGAFELTILKLR